MSDNDATWSLTIVGAGSGYTPSIVLGAARVSSAVLGELHLVDPDETRLDLMCHHLRALLAERGREMKIHTHPTFSGRPTQADVVVSLFRAGGLAARHQDERRALDNHIVGQETQGWAGFVAGLRNVPVARDVAKALVREESAAWHIVVSNPVDIVTRAACSVRPERTFGLCDMPWKVLEAAAVAGGRSLDALTYSYLGLNHLSWITDLRDHDGRKLLDSIIDGPGVLDVLSATLDADGRLARPLISITRELRAIPSPYLRYYYFAPEMILRASQARTTRAEDCELIQRFFEDACQKNDHVLAKNLAMRRGGWGIGLTVASACNHILGGRREVAIPCAPNLGAFAFLDADTIVEVPRVLVDLSLPEAPPPVLHQHIRGLITQVGAYEHLTAEAAATGAFDAAVVAAGSSPLIPSVDLARRMLRETIHEQQRWLPQFE